MKSFTQKTAIGFHKKMYGLLISLIISLSCFSQNVGINASGAQPNASAGLDVDFTNMGLLIPRVNLISTSSFAPLSAHVAGMVVYNTATANDVTPGFYCDNGTKWISGFIKGQSLGDMLYWNGSDWLRIPIGVPGQYLQISGAFVPTWGGNIFSTLTTTTATSITGTTAVSGGIITSDGGSTVVQRGVCWKSTQGATIADFKTNDGSGIGSFISNVTGLLPVTTYYARAYAINNTVVNYGNEVVFTTLPVLPTLAVTTAATAITGNTATTGGNVTATGGASILERGVCYATTTTPTIVNSKVVDPLPGSGSFVSNLTGLVGFTTYYARAYATNSVGTAYGAQISFTTLRIPPILTTVAASSITGTTAVSGASMTWGGGGYSNYQAYGVAYSTTSNSATPTKVATNSANGSVNINVPITPWVTNITGLTANTTYYIRSYLDVYPSGTGPWTTIYGNELSFTTASPTAPIIATTTAITGLSASAANTGGTITSDGGSPVTVKGVCWGISLNPVLGTGNFTSNGTGSGTFTSNITGLTGNTTYHVRSYATNNVGTSYGPDVQFTTWVQAAYTVGQNVGYGWCAYVAPDGSGYFVSPDILPTAPATTFTWGCNNAHVAVGTALGTGKTNTDLIITTCGANTAAGIARAYTGGGYNDWFLPSSNEFQLVATNYTLFGFSGGYTSYFTSSEYGTNYTYANSYFYTGSQAYSSGSPRNGDTYTHAIRAMRAFTAPSLATVTTASVTNISGTTATSGGDVTNDGGAPILAAGICWRTTSGPTIVDSKTSDATATGPFISNLTGLTYPTTFYVRAYATNAAGTAYGNEVSFTTISVSLATVTTNAITNLLGTSATTGGNVTGDGGSSIMNRGICWDITANPDLTTLSVSGGALYDSGSSLGTFISNLTGLTNGQQYYVRAFAINGVGTAYGNDVVFTPTGNSIPILTTSTITNPSPTGATFGGNITSDGGQPVTARGVCWSNLNYPPTIADSKTVDGTGTGTFISNITGLTAGNGYWVAAYATNSLGTSYGQPEYYIPIGLPIVATGLLAYTPLDAFAQVLVNITSDGGDALTAYGLVWGTASNPTVSSNIGFSNDVAIGSWFNYSLMQPVAQLTTYYVRAYATNGIGTSYGTEIVFTPGVLAVSTIKTDPIINKIGAVAEGGGTISYDGGSPVTASGICWSASANPDLVSNLGYTNDAYTSGQYFSNLSGLVLGTTYHVRAYATNGNGTGYGSDISFVATPATLGQTVSGGLLWGYVFSVDGTGAHGLLADMWGYSAADWGCPSTVTGATGTTVGTGMANTTAIINDITTNTCPSASIYGTFAAQICKSNGIDWYLPSKDEMNLLWTNQNADTTGGLSGNLNSALLTAPFWSSSEINATDVWNFDGTTWLNTGLKTAQKIVWPIRSF